MPRLLWAVPAPLLSLLLATQAAAQTSAKPAKTAREPVPITAEMEREAKEFIRQNHPELVELLSQLEHSNSTQYQQAIRDLSRAARSLADTEKRDPKKYVLDLRAWQVNSQIQVLVARLTMSPTPELKDELKAKLREQIDVRLEQQKLERERTETRLKRLQEAIAKLEETRDQEADRIFEKLTRSILKPDSKGIGAAKRDSSSAKPGRESK